MTSLPSVVRPSKSLDPIAQRPRKLSVFTEHFSDERDQIEGIAAHPLGQQVDVLPRSLSRVRLHRHTDSSGPISRSLDNLLDWRLLKHLRSRPSSLSSVRFEDTSHMYYTADNGDDSSQSLSGLYQAPTKPSSARPARSGSKNSGSPATSQAHDTAMAAPIPATAVALSGNDAASSVAETSSVVEEGYPSTSTMANPTSCSSSVRLREVSDQADYRATKTRQDGAQALRANTSINTINRTSTYTNRRRADGSAQRKREGFRRTLCKGYHKAVQRMRRLFRRRSPADADADADAAIATSGRQSQTGPAESDLGQPSSSDDVVVTAKEVKPNCCQGSPSSHNPAQAPSLFVSSPVPSRAPSLPDPVPCDTEEEGIVQHDEKEMVQQDDNSLCGAAGGPALAPAPSSATTTTPAAGSPALAAQASPRTGAPIAEQFTRRSTMQRVPSYVSRPPSASTTSIARRPSSRRGCAATAGLANNGQPTLRHVSSVTSSSSHVSWNPFDLPSPSRGPFLEDLEALFPATTAITEELSSSSSPLLGPESTTDRQSWRWSFPSSSGTGLGLGLGIDAGARYPTLDPALRIVPSSSSSSSSPPPAAPPLATRSTFGPSTPPGAVRQMMGDRDANRDGREPMPWPYKRASRVRDSAVDVADFQARHVYKGGRSVPEMSWMASRGSRMPSRRW